MIHPQPVLAPHRALHRWRASARVAGRRVAPLMLAGVDMGNHQPGTAVSVRMAGVALIYGAQPASAGELLALMLGGLDQQVRLRRQQQAEAGEADGPTRAAAAREMRSTLELERILAARIVAMWCWLPAAGSDAYIEVDRATGLCRLWRLAMGADRVPLATLLNEDGASQLDREVFESLLLLGPQHWTNHGGLEGLSLRFAQHRAALAAAALSESLDESPQELDRALKLARRAWPALDDHDGSWEEPASVCSPWVSVQLGRLALRRGHVRAALALLGRVRELEGCEVGWFDLAQAHDASGETSAAQAAFEQYTRRVPHDGDGWRRLLYCHLALGRVSDAEGALRGYRAAGGDEHALESWLLAQLGRLEGSGRSCLVGWLCARLTGVVADDLPIPELLAQIIERRFAKAAHSTTGSGGHTRRQVFLLLVDQLRLELKQVVHHHQAALRQQHTAPAQPPAPKADDQVAADRAAAEAEDRLVDCMVRVVLLGLPLLGAGRHQAVLEAAERTMDALRLWGDLYLGRHDDLEQLSKRGCLLGLARLAVS